MMPDHSSEPTLESLFTAIRAGDTSGVRTLLDAQPDWAGAFDPNEWCCRGTALGVAVGTGAPDLVELLLDRGADPNQKSAWWAGGFSPLDSVQPADRDWLVPLLIERGARVDAFSASRHGRMEDLARIIGADRFMVNQVAGDGQRPLHVAATVEVAAFLLEHGADLEARCVDHGSTPVQYAAGDRPAVAEYLVSRGARTDAFLLAALGHEEGLSALVAREPEVLSRPLSPEAFPAPGSPADHIYVYTLASYGMTPLHVAARKNRAELIPWMVTRGADLHARGGYDDQTPAHVAAWHDRADAIRALGEAGADLEMPSGPEHQTPPILWAMVAGSPEAIRALLECGVAADGRLLELALEGERGGFEPHTRGDAATYRAIHDIVEDFLTN